MTRLTAGQRQCVGDGVSRGAQAKAVEAQGNTTYSTGNPPYSIPPYSCPELQSVRPRAAAVMMLHSDGRMVPTIPGDVDPMDVFGEYRNL